jgi:diguanylate cyclase (GGDEF)-like protein
MSQSLDQAVTAVAADLMGATADNAVTVSERAMAVLVAHFRVDVSFLRHNDHTIHATKLFAQWPPRTYIPDPDPIGLVYFADADPVFAQAEYLKEPAVLRPEEPGRDEYERTIEEGTTVPQISLAVVPLLSGDITTGTLGFIKYGDREWTEEELRALRTVATLFAQLQARIEAEKRLQYLADHDDLSGVLNRRALICHLDERLATGSPGPVALLFIDLDRLKTINTYLGHNTGDLFIKAFAQRLREAIGDTPAALARVGGDEFVIVPAESLDQQAVLGLAHQLRVRLLDNPVVIGGEVLVRTVSIGVDVGLPGSDTSSDLLRRADLAVLSAKQTGGNKVGIFTPEMAAQDEICNDIELHLEGVIDAGGALVLRYLPEFDMRNGKILATEALVRWQHPTRGLLMPAQFIGIAESVNLAGKLGRHVMRAACAEFSQWRARGVGRDAVLRINVSPLQLVSDDFTSSVAATIGEFGLEAGAVCLEITETAVVEDAESARNVVIGLREIGVHVAIDDFGTGYSALSYLKSLPVDTLKIDRAFVRDLGKNADDLAIVRSIMNLAEEFDLKPVAEGVETAVAARTLLDVGCHRAQGYLLSPPIDGESMETMFAKRFLPLDFIEQPGHPNGVHA